MPLLDRDSGFQQKLIMISLNLRTKKMVWYIFNWREFLETFLLFSLEWEQVLKFIWEEKIEILSKNLKILQKSKVKLVKLMVREYLDLNLGF